MGWKERLEGILLGVTENNLLLLREILIETPSWEDLKHSRPDVLSSCILKVSQYLCL